jgi:hypothetical protein
VPAAVQGADDGPDAGAADRHGPDAEFLEDLEHKDMHQSPGAAAAQGQAHSFLLFLHVLENTAARAASQVSEVEYRLGIPGRITYI